MTFDEMEKDNVSREYLLKLGARPVCDAWKFDGACRMPSVLWRMPNGGHFHFVEYSTPETAPNAWLHTRLFASSRFVSVEIDPPGWLGAADVEYSSRIDAERVTLQFGSKSARKLDAGRKSIEDSPLFGGPRQGGLFE